MVALESSMYHAKATRWFAHTYVRHADRLYAYHVGAAW